MNLNFLLEGHSIGSKLRFANVESTFLTFLTPPPRARAPVISTACASYFNSMNEKALDFIYIRAPA